MAPQILIYFLVAPQLFLFILVALQIFTFLLVGEKKVSIGDRVFESPKALKEECRAMLFRYLEVTIDIARFFLFYVKSEASYSNKLRLQPLLLLFRTMLS